MPEQRGRSALVDEAELPVQRAVAVLDHPLAVEPGRIGLGFLRRHLSVSASSSSAARRASSAPLSPCSQRGRGWPPGARRGVLSLKHTHSGAGAYKHCERSRRCQMNTPAALLAAPLSESSRRYMFRDSAPARSQQAPATQHRSGAPRAAPEPRCTGASRGRAAVRCASYLLALEPRQRRAHST